MVYGGTAELRSPGRERDVLTREIMAQYSAAREFTLAHFQKFSFKLRLTSRLSPRAARRASEEKVKLSAEVGLRSVTIVPVPSEGEGRQGEYRPRCIFN